MAIRGSLSEASLPDVLQLLAMGKKSGCLSISHRSSFGYIYFDKGLVSYASVVNRRDRLGDMLVKSGMITHEQLESAVAMQSRVRNRRVGELLVEQGALTLEQLHKAIRTQIEEAVYFLFTWTEGTFNFESDVQPDQSDLLVSINPEALLLEGARRVDEWGLIEKKIPTFDLVFEIDRHKLMSSDAELTPEQRTVLQQVDGVRNIHAIVDGTGLVEFDVAKALYGLLTAGFVHRITPAPAGRPSAAVIAARTDEHRNLGIAFYRANMLEEASRELRRVLELHEDDTAARFALGMTLSRQGKWDEAVTTFSDLSRSLAAGYGVFHNLAYALEQLNRMEEAQVAIDAALRRGGIKDAKVQITAGAIRLQAGDVEGGDAALGAARVLMGAAVPPAAWFHYAALAAGLLGDTARASNVLREGTAAHPRSARLATTLAAVLERRGELEDARAAAERAVAEDPALPQAHKNLGDVLYRLARYEEALDAYERAVRARPDLGSDVYLKIGNLHLRASRQEEAARSWQRALDIDPTNDIARRNLESMRQAFR